MRIFLNHGTLVCSFAPYEVVKKAHYSDRSSHQYAIVHIGSCDLDTARPKAEEADDGKVNAGESVVENAPDTRNVPWTPFLESSIFDCYVLRGIIRRVADLAFDATIEEKDACKKVGRV